nr:cob(I)yrinic acid a,c-diamide adenosyltransferase [Candidatus Njordarchaeum guaymaensis]
MEVEMETGLVHVLTGDGPGKTTSALGIALRAIGHGYNVYMVMFVKGKPNYGEILASRMLPGFTIIYSGREQFLDRKNPDKVDVELAQKSLEHAKEVIMSERYDVVILDEINVAIDYGLVRLKDIIQLIKEKPKKVELILTGRRARKELLEYADYVTEMQEIKHPYTRGILVREGIEY